MSGNDPKSGRDALFIGGLPLKTVCRSIALYYGVSVEDLTGPGYRESRRLSRLRRLAVALSYWFTANSTRAIARHYHYADHSGVSHAVRVTAAHLERDELLRADILKLRRVLLALNQPPQATPPASGPDKAAA